MDNLPTLPPIDPNQRYTVKEARAYLRHTPPAN